MNLKTLRLSVPALAVLAALCSCSVKEDRTECPCCVTVMTETDSQCLVCFFDGGTSLLDRKTMMPEELTSGDNFTDVRKGPLSVCVLQTSGDALVSGNHTGSCREGMEADPVYAWSVSTMAEGEELLVRSSLQKQYAGVTVFLAGDFPYDVRVESALGGAGPHRPLPYRWRRILVPAPGGGRELPFQDPAPEGRGADNALLR